LIPVQENHSLKKDANHSCTYVLTLFGFFMAPLFSSGLPCLAAALAVLAALSAIDLKTRLLPNALVLLLAALGVLFHLSTGFALTSPLYSVAGAATGYGLLWTIRFFANQYYGQDSLGLGDVKLLGAGGLWLGPDGVLLAITLGAFAGLVHGVAVGLYTAARTKSPVNLHRLAIPAGPGFAAGLIASAAWLWWLGL